MIDSIICWPSYQVEFFKTLINADLEILESLLFNVVVSLSVSRSSLPDLQLSKLFSAEKLDFSNFVFSTILSLFPHDSALRMRQEIAVSKRKMPLPHRKEKTSLLKAEPGIVNCTSKNVTGLRQLL